MSRDLTPAFRIAQGMEESEQGAGLLSKLHALDKKELDELHTLLKEEDLAVCSGEGSYEQVGGPCRDWMEARGFLRNEWSGLYPRK
jgi:hypothetical protein